MSSVSLISTDVLTVEATSLAGTQAPIGTLRTAVADWVVPVASGRQGGSRGGGAKGNNGKENVLEKHSGLLGLQVDRRVAG